MTARQWFTLRLPKALIQATLDYPQRIASPLWFNASSIRARKLRAMIRVLILLLLITTFGGPALGEDALTQDIYSSVEGTIRREFDGTMQAIARRGTGRPGVRFEVIRQNIKVMFYNRAVLFASCVVEAERGRSPQVRRVPAEYNLILTTCVESKLADLDKFNNLRNYVLVFFADRVETCGEASRLRELESLFPPYDFLELSEPRLYDFARYNECLMRSP